MESARASEAATTSSGNSSLESTRIELRGQEIEVLRDSVLVKPDSAARARALLASIDARVDRVSPSGYWRVLRPANISLEAFLSFLNGRDELEDVQPEGIIRACDNDNDEFNDGDEPDGQYTQYQWNLEQIGWHEFMDDGEVTPADIEGVVVAVIDSGVAYEDHVDDMHTYVAATDLGAAQVIPGPDYVDNDEHPNDVSGHGTHIAGVIAADGGVVGVAPRAAIMPIRVLGADNAGTELALVDAILYATDQGVDVINLSLSFPSGYIPGGALAEAVQAAEDQDIIVLAAAGNEGADSISYPAAFSSVIAVGASRLTGGGFEWVADYSNTGAGLDLVAPGGTLELDVNEDGVPDGIPAQTIEPGNPSNLGYYVMAGTSQAVAHVSGTAVWLRAAGASASEIRSAVVNNTRAVWGSKFFTTLAGTGNLDMPDTLEGYQEDAETSEEDVRYYVNVFPMMYEDKGNHAAFGMIKVIDELGTPAQHVMLVGRWFGMAEANFAVITNNVGEAWVSVSSGFDLSEPAAFGLQVDRVLDGFNHVAPPPVGFYFLSPGMNGAFLGWQEDERTAEAYLLMSITPGEKGMPHWATPSFLAKPLGPVDGFAPMALVFNSDYLPGLSDVPSDDRILVEAEFDSPLEFGWGSEVALTLEIVPDVSMADGIEIDFAICPFDPAIYYQDLAPVAPILNSPSSSFDVDNYAFYEQLIEDPAYFSSLEAVFGQAPFSSLIAGAPFISIIADAPFNSLIADAPFSSLIAGAPFSSLIAGGDDSEVVADAPFSTIIADSTMTVEIAGSESEIPTMEASSYQDEASDVPMELEAGGGGNFGNDFVSLTPDSP